MDCSPCSESDDIAGWLAAETWPFHGPGRASWFGPGIRSFWIGERIGLVRIYDLGDPTPMFDLRIRSEHRGRGIGKEALRWIARHVFTEYPDKIRIEGCTRADNAAMRRVFEACGWVKEAHHRKAWRGFDAIGYAIPREDWESGRVTPVPW